MSSTAQSALIMLAAGIGIPVLAGLNAALGQKLGSPAGAGVILFVVALTTACVVMLLTGGSVARIGSAPPHLLLAGTLVAFYVLSITWIAPTFGIGNAIFFVLLGQLVSAGLIDHFALFGAQHAPLNPTRAIGIALMILGVFFTQIAGRG